MKRAEIDHYARITVAATVFLAALAVADKETLTQSFARMRFALPAKAMTEAFMWDTISSLLHEALMRREDSNGEDVYVLTAEGDMWVFEHAHGLGLADAGFKRALVQCGLDPDTIVRRVEEIGESLRQAAKTRGTAEDSPLADMHSGYVAWRMRWRPDRKWSIDEMAHEFGVEHRIVLTQIDAAMRMDWLNVHNVPGVGLSYSLSSLGIAGANRLMRRAMEATSAVQSGGKWVGSSLPPPRKRARASDRKRRAAPTDDNGRDPQRSN